MEQLRLLEMLIMEDYLYPLSEHEYKPRYDDEGYRYGNYRIAPIDLDGAARNGVYYNHDGAWLGDVQGEIIEGEILLYYVKIIFEDGKRFPAPTDWKRRIITDLGDVNIFYS